MEKKFALLDTSLRDGGHRNDFHFQPQDLTLLLCALDESKMDYVEVGYRNGFFNATHELGAAAWCNKAYLQYCHQHLKHSKMAVMALPDHLKLEELDELKACGVKLLRLYGIKDQLHHVLPFIEKAHEMDLEIAINLTFISNYTAKALKAALAQLAASQPDMVYFADSNGSLLPSEVQTLYQSSLRHSAIPLGFHAHDNLGLAQTNSIAAIQSGAQFVDVTLAGMGKGIGNLKTEFFIAYLLALGIKQYALEPLLRASNHVRGQFHIGSELLTTDEFIKALPHNTLK